MAAYNFNRGINKSWEFQGLVGSNVYLFVGALGFTFLVFVVLYVMGTGMTICLIVTVLLGVGSWMGVFALNTKYGEHGLMKAGARRSSPKRITNRQSRLFINLNEDLPKAGDS